MPKRIFMNAEKSIRTQGVISLLLAFGFLILLVSGLVLYVAPQCRVADEIMWRMLGLSKTRWQSVHLTFAFVSLILACIHLFVFNWKVLLSYARRGARTVLFLRPELFCSLVIAGVLLAGAALLLPPFNLLPYGQDQIQMRYQEEPGDDDVEDRGRGLGRRRSGG